MKSPVLSRLLVVAALIGGTAHAEMLFNNGPVVDAAGLSIVSPPAATVGWGVQRFFNNRLAEDFVVPVGSTWHVTDLDLYAYQDGATSFVFQNVSWAVIAGPNINSGAVIASGITDVSNGGLMGYRSTADRVGDTSRAIYDIKADIADLTLPAGSYWLSWSLATPNPYSGPYVPTTSDFRLGNMMQASGGSYFTPSDPGTRFTYAAPFQLNGTVAAVPEPAAAASLAAGLMLLAAVARRRQR